MILLIQTTINGKFMQKLLYKRLHCLYLRNMACFKIAWMQSNITFFTQVL